VAATSDDATCGPWFATGWYATFNLTAPDSGDLWIVQVIVEPDVYAGDGSYAEETDTSDYGARVNVTNGRGVGWGALIKAPGEFGSMGAVSIGNNGRSGSAHVLLGDPGPVHCRTELKFTVVGWPAPPEPGLSAGPAHWPARSRRRTCTGPHR